MQCRKENVHIHSNYSRNHVKVQLNRYKHSFQIFQTIQEKVARALNATPEEINLDTSTTKDVELLWIKAEKFDRLMQLIKDNLSTIKKNREFITLAPETWLIKEVANFFNVTENTACKAESLVQEKRILDLPDKKGENFISR